MSDEQQRCIWCGEIRKGSLEHILPESLGCPPEFVLREGVCSHCNNSLSHIDQALLHEFEIVTYINGVGRKGGRPPAINSWASIAAAKVPDGSEVHLNMGPHSIQALGKMLSASSASNGISNVTVGVQNGVGTITFDQRFGTSPKFVRAIYKVAVESIAYFSGLDAARESVIDEVRVFVKDGRGEFRVLMVSTDDAGHHFGPHWTMPGSSYPIVAMTIFGTSFITDFDPEQKALARIITNAPEEGRFQVLPPG